MISSSFALTLSASDGVAGNGTLQKVVTNLVYSGNVNQYVSSQMIGCAAPTGVTATASTTGGTLPSEAIYYKVTALNGVGETTGSAEATTSTIGTTSSVFLSWNAVPSATSYRVYRGTSAGGESVYFPITGTTFTDTGASGTAGTVPGSNSTGTTWTPTLSEVPLQAFYIRNLSAVNNATVAWTPTGGSSATVQTLAPLGAIAFLQPTAVSGGGITALTVTTTPGTAVEGFWTA